MVTSNMSQALRESESSTTTWSVKSEVPVSPE